ncbi:MAG: translation initiation factor IF-2 [Eubacterium sp.]|nr:translation initiation factor IF-2 [Eubacterium sp.]
MAEEKKENLKENTEGTAKAAPKKKKFIQIFRPQNATSQEAKNYTKTGQSMQADKARKAAAKPKPAAKPVKKPAPDKKAEEEKAAAAAAAAEKAAAEKAAAEKAAAEKAAAEAAAAEKAAAEKAAAEKAAAEKAAAEKAAAEKAAAEKAAAEKAAAEKAEAEKAAAEKPAAAKTEEKPAESRTRRTSDGKPADKPARDAAPRGTDRPAGQQTRRTAGRTAETGTDGRPPRRQPSDRSTSDRRDDTGRRPAGDRPAGTRTSQSRPSGDRPARTGDRTGTGTARTPRTYGDRPEGARGERTGRSFTDRNASGRPASGDRTGRTGTGYGDRTRKPGFPSKDEDTRPGNAARPRTDKDRKPSAPASDLGLKKPGRDTSHKDKDKSKDSLRENKYTEDRKNGKSGTGRKNTQSQIPKALQKHTHKAPEKKEETIKEIQIPEKLTVRELAEAMKMQPAALIKKLFLEGTIATMNTELDYDRASEIALSYDIIAMPEEKEDVIAELLKEDEESEEVMVNRPPVVCVMGHVDHGKTSLLDAIRDSHVTDREAGGITQHIGAYMVEINGQKITFLDTPGHEAFTAMRMRGANSTDIAVLVVAADDGVMPQTVEAINHAKAGGVEIMVAINKIDKPGANIDRVKQELAQHELTPEDWGGSTVMVPVSARTREGLDNLLEMILLTSEVLELKSNPNRKARGLVLEARLDKGKGPVANVLIQKGTLHVGDYIAAGACSGKVRAMMNENGRKVTSAGPSMPVEILGLSDVPHAGEILVALDSDKEAKAFAATFESENRNKLLEDTKTRMSLDDLFSRIQEGNLKELNLIVKADVQGSVEAVTQSLMKLSNEEVAVKVIHSGAGAINESDVSLAAAGNAIIIGFNVKPEPVAKNTAEQENVDIRLYRVIYDAINDVEHAMKGMLDPVYEEKIIGHAEIRQIFKASGVGNIAGSYVLDGTIQRNCKVRITRGKDQVFEGNLASLKRFKDDVKEVRSGFECGLVFDGFNDIAELDQVEAYIMVEVER